MFSFLRKLALLVAGLALVSATRADDGYRLWLRYDKIGGESLRQAYAAAITEIAVPGASGGANASTISVARDELVAGLSGLLGTEIPVVAKATRDHALIVGTPRTNFELLALIPESDLRAIGEEGFVLLAVTVGAH